MALVDFRSFDIFHSPNYDIAESSSTGGFLTLSTVVLCLLCFFSEISTYRHGVVREMVFLENSIGGKDHVQVTLNVTIYELSCQHVSLDIQDHMGRYEVDEHDEKELVKVPTREGGCRFEGHFWVRNQKGNFHFTPRGVKNMNETITHAIHELKFGEVLDEEFYEDIPTDSYTSLESAERDNRAGMTHDYLVKLVRTEIWDDEEADHHYPYQYTYSHRRFVGHHNGKPLPPRIFFRLDFSPLTMKFSRIHEPLWSFLSFHVALLGGTFAVTKMAYDSFHVARHVAQGGKFL